jgi:hypothetical protein
VGGKGDGFDDLRDCRDIKVIVGGMVGDVPRDIEDSAEDFRLENNIIICHLKLAPN